ncbi:hypothetical protein ACNVEB_000824 [Streptococcus equinus]|uniref:hypothetical protein n=1 Tax=Streptococcus equinus TaxID=1335 RepID=UPI003BF85F97
MKEIQYIVVIDGSSYKTMYEYMLADLDGLDNVTIVVDYPRKNKFKKIILKSKVQKFFKGSLDWMAYEENNLFLTIDRLSKKNNRICVVFFNASLNYNPYTAGTLKKYKRMYPSMKYVMFYLDIMNTGVSINADYLRKKNIFDLVYTIDYEDALRTKAIFWRTIYSKKDEYPNIQLKDDIYFCASSKGRGELILECVKEAMKNNISMLVDIIPNSDEEYLKKNKMKNVRVRSKGDYIEYSEVLKNELSSKCLLEIVQEGQVALTLRPYEAVLYNRKLLTNNKSILDFPYYTEKYMQYFEKVQEIDWEWIKSDVQVNYDYQGEFSPKYLLEDIKKRLEEKK